MRPWRAHRKQKFWSEIWVAEICGQKHGRPERISMLDWRLFLRGADSGYWLLDSISWRFLLKCPRDIPRIYHLTLWLAARTLGREMTWSLNDHMYSRPPVWTMEEISWTCLGNLPRSAGYQRISTICFIFFSRLICLNDMLSFGIMIFIDLELFFCLVLDFHDIHIENMLLKDTNILFYSIRALMCPLLVGGLLSIDCTQFMQQWWDGYGSDLPMLWREVFGNKKPASRAFLDDNNLATWSLTGRWRKMERVSGFWFVYMNISQMSVRSAALQGKNKKRLKKKQCGN